MTERPVSLTPLPSGYADWLADLKTRIHGAQQRAALAVNRELVLLYWQIGRDILERQRREGWGAKVIERLAQDLRGAFPDMKGFSRANLMYMRAFAEAWPDETIVQQAVGRLPWGHNLVLLTKLKAAPQRLLYAQRAVEHGCGRRAGHAVEAGRGPVPPAPRRPARCARALRPVVWRARERVVVEPGR